MPPTREAIAGTARANASINDRGSTLDRYAQMLTDQRASGVSGAAALSMLSVAVREIGLLERA